MRAGLKVSLERGLEYVRVNDVTISDNREHCSKLISINKHGTLQGISHISFHTIYKYQYSIQYIYQYSIQYILVQHTIYILGQYTGLPSKSSTLMTIYLSMILSMSESLFSYLPCKTDMVFYQGTVSVISSDPPGHHSMMAIPIYNGTLKVFSDQVYIRVLCL